MKEREAGTHWRVNPITLTILAFAFGIFVSSFVAILPLVALLVVLVGGAVLLAEKIWQANVGREVLMISLTLISFGLGSFRYATKDFHEPQTPSSTGVVINEPEDKENVRSFVFQSDNGEKVLVSVPLYTPVQYGDRVEVTGKLEQPGVIEGFDYGAYLSKDDIYYTLGFAQVEVLSSGQGDAIKAALFKIKNNFIEHAKRILPEPEASLLMGLIVAGRDALPKDIIEEFRRAGVVHIVVLSGFNITLIAEFLRRMFQKLFLVAKMTRFAQSASLASILGVILFVIMTGGEATVVRAALMATIVIAAKFFGRSYSASRALLVAGFLMLIENPKILVFDPSFQLSFLATLGLIYVMPVVEKKLHWVTEKWQLRETLSQTISTQVTVLPLLVYSVGNISIVSLPANLLILLIVPATMLVGFVAVLLSYIGWIIAWPLTLASHLLLSYILFVAHLLSSLPFAVVSLPL